MSSALQNIVVHPNPNNGVFVIETNSGLQQTLLVYDVNGRLVLNQTVTGKANIDASALPDGTYSISLTGNDGKITTKKIVISH